MLLIKINLRNTWIVSVSVIIDYIRINYNVVTYFYCFNTSSVIFANNLV